MDANQENLDANLPVFKSAKLQSKDHIFREINQFQKQFEQKQFQQQPKNLTIENRVKQNPKKINVINL